MVVSTPAYKFVVQLLQLPSASRHDTQITILMKIFLRSSWVRWCRVSSWFFNITIINWFISHVMSSTKMMPF